MTDEQHTFLSPVGLGCGMSPNKAVYSKGHSFVLPVLVVKEEDCCRTFQLHRGSFDTKTQGLDTGPNRVKYRANIERLWLLCLESSLLFGFGTHTCTLTIVVIDGRLCGRLRLTPVAAVVPQEKAASRMSGIVHE